VEAIEVFSIMGFDLPSPAFGLEMLDPDTGFKKKRAGGAI
jgi:hypothetical protein